METGIDQAINKAADEDNSSQALQLRCRCGRCSIFHFTKCESAPWTAPRDTDDTYVNLVTPRLP
ncbi:protein of unknown function [Ralstonia solanacearum CFBP2957]|nr:protein of unknown function [Ralstonia solanacearum CFBP2957]